MSEKPHNPKRPRLQEADSIGFEGAGVRVPVIWPNHDAPPAISILKELLEAGVIIPDIPAAIAVVEAGLDLHGDRRAAEAFAVLLSRAGGGKRGAELRAALLGAFDEGSGQDAADKFGITRQTWHTNTMRLRKKLLCRKKNV